MFAFRFAFAFWQGTNVDEAKVLIATSGMKILPVADLEVSLTIVPH